MGRELFDGNSDSETEVSGIKTNQDYAKSYNKFREKELLKKLKDRQKNNESDSSTDEDSESSDEDFSVNKQFDEEFFKTLSSLKSKNPEIYNKNTTFFEGQASKEESHKETAKNKKQKAMTIKDYERKVILEKGGRYVDDEDVDKDHVKTGRAASPTYVQEQKNLRNEIKKAFDLEENDDEGFGGLFRKREKTDQQTAQEQEEYTTWLAGKREKIDESSAKVLDPLRQYWNNPNLSKQEQFLRDYVLNHGFHNRDVGDVPTYDEVVADISEDEKEVEKQEEFEHKYNFRFEEPDKNFIQRYPREVHISVRKKDESRKEKRAAVRERKLKEKEEKFKELEILKEIKRKEIQEKIQKLKEVTGNEELPFKEDELNEDFDPEAHDRRMKEVFNEQYYGVDEGDEKPECPEIEELQVEDWDNFDPEKDEGVNDDYEPHCEDEDFNMDCEYDPQAAKASLQNELIENTRKRRKGRRRNPFMEMIKKEKPAFNPDDEKSYSEYIDEYYKMDCEDIIGDTPCRFKYVETFPNDYGLTLEEILLAKTKELNQWVSLKKTVQIKTKQAELRDKKLFKMKAKNGIQKRKIFTSIYGPPSEDENDEAKTSGKGTKTKSEPADKSETNENGSSKKKKKKKKKKTKSNVDGNVQIKSENPTPSQDTVSNPFANKPEDKAKLERIEDNSKCDATKNEVKVENNKAKLAKHKKKKTTQNASADIGANDKVSRQKNRSDSNKHTKIRREKNKAQPPKNYNRKPFKPTSSEGDIYSQLSDERLKAYGLNPTKFRKQINFAKRQQNQFKKSANGKNKSKKSKKVKRADASN